MDEFDDIESEDDVNAEEGAGTPELQFRLLESSRHLLLPLARGQGAAIAFLLLAIAGDTLFNISFPLIERLTVDEGLIGRDWSVVFFVVLFMGASAVAVTLLGLAMDALNARVCSTVTASLRQTLFARLPRLPLAYFNRVEGGEIISRFAGDVAAVEDGLLAIVPWLILPGLEVIYSTVLMFVFNARLGVVGLVVFPLNLLAPRMLIRKSFALGYEKRRREARLMAAIEHVSAQPIIRAFGMAERSQQHFAALSGAWRQTAYRFDLYSALVERTTYTGVYVIHAAIFALGAYWAYRGVITVGTLVAFEAMFLTMGDAISHVTEAIPMLAEAGGGLRRIGEFVEEAESPADASDAVDLPSLRDAIVFRGVSFSYPGARFRVSGFDLKVRAGTRVAIVGRSGSGKSTVGALLLRFETPGEGAILFDGVDISRALAASLRSQIGVVFQDTFLFHATIADNIGIGKAGATRDEIESAAQAAQLHDFVASLPLGYDTIVGERGGRLSGGQKQRIAIARALLRNPSVLLLDEATSALDPATEAAFDETLQRNAQGRTVIAMTHRLASVKDYDWIVVMDRGAIRESGTHASLLRQRGIYASLWRRQTDSGRRERRMALKTGE